MSTLLDAYNEMSADQQDHLGQGSSKINTAGCHLVTIESMMVIDDSRVKVDFKNAAGQTIDLTAFLTNKDPSKVEATVNRAMNQLAQMCTAAGLKLKNVLSKSVAGSIEYRTGTVATEEYPAVKGKKLYVTTTTVIEGDDKDATKAYVNQQVDVFKFFDTKKRNGLEISTDVDEGQTMAEAERIAKETYEVGYKFTSNKACQTKLAQLVNGSKPAAQVEAANVEVDDDDI